MWGTPTFSLFAPLVSKATDNLYGARIKETGLYKNPRDLGTLDHLMNRGIDDEFLTWNSIYFAFRVKDGL